MQFCGDTTITVSAFVFVIDCDYLILCSLIFVRHFFLFQMIIESRTGKMSNFQQHG